MAELKTRPNDKSVTAFLDAVSDETQRKDSYEILAMMEKVSGCKPQMWGDSIVGFGSYNYLYKRGAVAEWPIVAFSPRKQNLTLYIMPGFDRFAELMASLGKHKTGKGCLYIKRLDDIDRKVLKELVAQSVKFLRKSYPCA